MADLGHEFGEDGVAPLRQVAQVERALLSRRCICCNVTITVRVVTRSTTIGEDHGAAQLLVELDLVDHGGEAFVVGAQRLEHLPDGLEPLVVVESGDWICVVGDGHGNDDVAVGLAFAASHHSTNGLDNIDDRVARTEEEHGVKCWDIDAFREAAGIRQDSNSSGSTGSLQPAKFGVALEHVLRPVDVVDVEARTVSVIFGEQEVVHHLGCTRREGLARSDGLCKGNSTLHGDWICDEVINVSGVLRQAVVATNDPSDFIKGEVERVHGASHLLGDDFFGDRQHDDSVVRQEPLGHGFTEHEAMELRAIEGLVIHGGEECVSVLRLGLDGFAIDPRGGRHVETLRTVDVGVVMDANEGCLFISCERCPRRAVCLIADDEVKTRQTFGLRLVDHANRLIGRKHDGQTIEAFGRSVEVLDELRCIRRSRVGQVERRNVIVLVLVLADLRVRTHSE